MDGTVTPRFTVPFFVTERGMKTTAIVETTFSAAHSVPNHPTCGERHGHTWRVRVETAQSAFLDESALATIPDTVHQYHGHDLDRYLPGVETTCAGLAAFFRERFSEFPVTAIEVMTDDGRGVRAEWQVR